MRDWLKEIRIEKGMTMKELGAKLGISESYYCAIENGERQKKMDMLVVAGLSTALEIPIAEVARLECEYVARLCKSTT